MHRRDRQPTSRRAWLVRSFALGAVMALGLSSTSCLALVAGVHDTEIDFLVTHSDNNRFFGWPEITIVVRFWIVQGLCVGAGLAFFYAEWVRA